MIFIRGVSSYGLGVTFHRNLGWESEREEHVSVLRAVLQTLQKPGGSGFAKHLCLVTEIFEM